MNNAYIRAQQCKVKEAKFPFVKIGTQYWTKRNLDLSVTPQGNAIPEMQANGNVEKITNIADREFSSDTGFWDKTSGCTIGAGTVNMINIAPYTGGLTRSGFTSGKWYKVTFDIVNWISGVPFVNDAGGVGKAIPSANGTYTIYLNPVNPKFRFTTSSAANNFGYDNISIQEIGLSGSQELYDGIYAQTSGTVEQKTYAAVKAAAMWSNYNNDAPTGIIYGKLYNWFAVKLFQMDIDYYNAANPNKPYIWRMPTQAEFQTLSTYLGGDAVSGGHLKEIGLDHWLTPNTGADNSSGFSAISGGSRLDTGIFTDFNIYEIFWSISELSNSTASRTVLISSTSATSISSTVKVRGYAIRLIKA